jgi:hypothetical protein
MNIPSLIFKRFWFLSVSFQIVVIKNIEWHKTGLSIKRTNE